MRHEAVGDIVYEATTRLEPVKVGELAAAIGSPTSEATAALVPWFGVTAGGQERLVDTLGMDLSRALLAGHKYEWGRPFEPGETVAVRVVVESVFAKGDNDFAVVVSEFRDDAGELIQRQQTTFIERSAA